MSSAATCFPEIVDVSLDEMSMRDRVKLAADVDDPDVAWQLFGDRSLNVRKALATNRSPKLSPVISKMATSNDPCAEIALTNPILPEKVALKVAKSADHWHVDALLNGKCSEKVLLAVAERNDCGSHLLEKTARLVNITEQVAVAVLQNRDVSLRAMIAAVRHFRSPEAVDLLFDGGCIEQTWRAALKKPSICMAGDAVTGQWKVRNYDRVHAQQLLVAVVAAPGATAKHLHLIAVASTATHDLILERSERTGEPLLAETLEHIAVPAYCSNERGVRVANHPCVDDATLMLLAMQNKLRDAASAAQQRFVERQRALRAVER